MPRLDVALKRLDEIEAGLERAAESIGSYAEALTEEVMSVIFATAAREITGMVRGFLMVNLLRSGVGQRTKGYDSTNNLQRAVKNSIVRARMDRGRLVIRVQMPTNMPAYVDGKGNSTPFYEVAGSLNYGAVRAPHQSKQQVDLPTGMVRTTYGAAIGERAKRTVKKYALGGDVSARALHSVEAGSKANRTPGRKGFQIGVATKDTKKSVTLSGGAVVIKPKNFYRLTKGQQDILLREFFKRVEKHAFVILGRETRAA